MTNIHAKFEVHHYEDTNGNAKYKNWDGFGCLGSSRIIDNGNITIR